MNVRFYPSDDIGEKIGKMVKKAANVAKVPKLTPAILNSNFNANHELAYKEINKYIINNLPKANDQDRLTLHTFFGSEYFGAFNKAASSLRLFYLEPDKFKSILSDFVQTLDGFHRDRIKNVVVEDSTPVESAQANKEVAGVEPQKSEPVIPPVDTQTGAPEQSAVAGNTPAQPQVAAPAQSAPPPVSSETSSVGATQQPAQPASVVANPAKTPAQIKPSQPAPDQPAKAPAQPTEVSPGTQPKTESDYQKMIRDVQESMKRLDPQAPEPSAAVNPASPKQESSMPAPLSDNERNKLLDEIGQGLLKSQIVEKIKGEIAGFSPEKKQMIDENISRILEIKLKKNKNRNDNILLRQYVQLFEKLVDLTKKANSLAFIKTSSKDKYALDFPINRVSAADVAKSRKIGLVVKDLAKKPINPDKIKDNMLREMQTDGFDVNGFANEVDSIIESGRMAEEKKRTEDEIVRRSAPSNVEFEKVFSSVGKFLQTFQEGQDQIKTAAKQFLDASTIDDFNSSLADFKQKVEQYFHITVDVSKVNPGDFIQKRLEKVYMYLYPEGEYNNFRRDNLSSKEGKVANGRIGIIKTTQQAQTKFPVVMKKFIPPTL